MAVIGHFEGVHRQVDVRLCSHMRLLDLKIHRHFIGFVTRIQTCNRIQTLEDHDLGVSSSQNLVSSQYLGPKSG